MTAMGKNKVDTYPKKNIIRGSEVLAKRKREDKKTLLLYAFSTLTHGSSSMRQLDSARLGVLTKLSGFRFV